VLRCAIDHIVITARSLAAGVDHVRRALGVTPESGGEHPRMGTHNALLRLGEATYLEVIAVNPNAPRPNRPRWFELDGVDASGAPRLATWVARTDDIQSAVAASPLVLGDIEPMSRGPLKWRITIPANGSLPAQGLAPTLIQWSDSPHPAGKLRDAGCSLLRLEGFHPEAETIRDMLTCVAFEGEFSISPVSRQTQPYLVAHIHTPHGVRRLY
jgi:hypothetical protein